MNLSLATLDDIDALVPLVRVYHEFDGVESTDSARRETIEPLLREDSALGRIWLIETSSGTVGYIALCFGYSIEFGGRDAFIDEFFIVEPARGQDLGRRVLEAIKTEAENAGVRALHLEVALTNTAAKKLYSGTGFVSERC
ncbi:MAG TPA: GNAT family N-acetyltransferase [Woeseiaceae bacterium]|nr:GNAT family N-acetyltransferase [Woeseiaceae bacterium]